MKFGFIGFLFGALLLYFWISLPYYSGDVKNHVAWGMSLLEDGSYGFFDRKFPGYSFPTYPPLIMYSFALSWGFYQSMMGLTYWLNSVVGIFPSLVVHWMEWENVWISFLKLPGMIATIVFAGVIPWILKKSGEKLSIKNPYLMASLIIFNPAVIYVSSVWGQTDLVQNLFLLLAIGLLFAKRFWLSFILAGIALMTKHTILLLWGVYIFYLLKEFGFKKSLYAVGVSLGIFYLSYLPFHSFSLIWPLQFYYSNFTLVDFGIAENAINMWGVLQDFKYLSVTQSFLGLSYNAWGYLLFLVPVLPLTYLFWVRKTTAYQLFYYLFMVSAFYFLFFTRMHERYMIPVVLFLSILFCIKKFHIYNLIYFTFLHFINVYRGLYQPNIPFVYDLARSNQFLLLLAMGYVVFMAYNYLVLWKELIKQPNREKLFR